jgi:uncharacterized membrane protein (UPF0182 family)
VGYELYYWLRVLYKYLVFAGVTAIFFSVFFFNFWIGSRYLGAAGSSTEKKTPGYRDVSKLFRTGSMRVYLPLSFLLTIPIAIPLFRQWEAVLFYIFGPASGIQDPAYGRDISYYLFSFPIYSLVQRQLSIALLMLLVSLAILYWLEKRLLAVKNQPLPRGARWHLSGIILVIFLVEIWGLSLQRYALLYSTSHEPLFFGPGWIQMRVIVPILWASMVLLTGMAVSLVSFINTRRGLRFFAFFSILFGVALGFRYSNTLTNTLHAYVVKPNELSKLQPFIEKSIEGTLSAYKLTDVETRFFDPEPTPGGGMSPTEVKDVLRNIPVWDGEMLNDVYNHLQELRTYYDFSTVDVNRFTIKDNYQQTFLAAREFRLEDLPPGARTWVNEHMSYTHGYGYVMTPAEQAGDEPLEWLARGIPTTSSLDFEVKEPAIYFGLVDSSFYSIAPNDYGEFDYPKGGTNVTRNYQGAGGVPLVNPLVKALFAYYFWDRNLLFTTKTNDESRILFRRNIRDRVERLTPYLLLDKDAYLAVTPERLYWIQDGYTLSNWFPYAAKSSTDKGEISYIRNSVKVVVDAYNGTVDYYVFDPDDPIIQAYKRIYPGVFKDKDEMPEHLLAQARYPQDYFNIQMGIYAKYHQEDPQVFYHQEDVWDFAATETFKDAQFTWRSQKSYYLTLDLIGEEGRLDFLLLSPFSPRGRTNLRTLVVVGGDPWNYGRIVTYSFPKGELVYGPHQINAFINQDTNVSAQFTLWNQAGSEVEVGKMIMLPIGKTMTYIQPVYLKAVSATSIPELKRLIMVQYESVVMESSLEEGYVKLQERLSELYEMGEGRQRAAIGPGPGDETRNGRTEPDEDPKAETGPQPAEPQS